MGNLKEKGTVEWCLQREERTGKTSKGISKAMAWFAIAARKSMNPEREPSKVSQITTNISTILNALGVGRPIFYNLHTIS